MLIIKVFYKDAENLYTPRYLGAPKDYSILWTRDKNKAASFLTMARARAFLKMYKTKYDTKHMEFKIIPVLEVV